MYEKARYRQRFGRIGTCVYASAMSREAMKAGGESSLARVEGLSRLNGGATM